MSELIKISGNVLDVFGSIDFYQNLTVTGLSSFEDLRKGFINDFFDDYKKNSNDENIEYVTKGIILDDIDNSANGDEQPDNIEYVNKGIILDDVGSKHQDLNGYLSSRNLLSNNIEYVNNGVLLDDLNSPFLNDLFNEKENADVEYSSNGVVLDDYDVKEEVNNYNVGIDEDDYTDTEKINNSNVVNEDIDEDDLLGCMFNEKAVQGINDNYLGEDDTTNSSYLDEDEYFDDEDVPNNNYYLNENNKEVKNVKIEKSEKGVSECNIKNNNVKKLLDNDKTDTQKTYSSVREYVKLNKGCSVNDVLAYFPYKDVKKALIGSKIVEKNKKLYVV